MYSFSYPAGQRTERLQRGTLSTTTTADVRRAPGLALDQQEAERMTMTNRQLIEEAVAVNHLGVDRKTLKKYQSHLEHLDVYLATVHGAGLLDATRKHVQRYMIHLDKAGGPAPDPLRAPCEWCRTRGYPNGRSGEGWSPSTRKSHLSAARFAYHHCLEEDLRESNPTAGLKNPKVTVSPRYTPSADEVQKMFDAPGRPKDRLLAHWMFYAPSRRETYANATWKDIDLDAGTWRIVGKWKKVDVFDLHPVLVREFRAYLRWQQQEALSKTVIRDALSDHETAYVLLTRTGRRTRPECIAKMIKWRAIRAGVGIEAGNGRRDARAGGKWSRLSPHAMRRGWADIALNHPEHPVPIDVVSEVLHHSDISTTRRHYAHTKPERARAALRAMRLSS